MTHEFSSPAARSAVLEGSFAGVDKTRRSFDLRCLRDPDAIGFASLWLFIFSLPWEYQVSVPLVGTISRLFGGISTVCGLMAIIIAGRIRLPGWTQVLMSLFFGWACMSYAWTIDPSASRLRIGTYCQLFVMATLIWNFSSTLERHRQLMRAYVFGSYVSVLAIFSNFLHRAEFTEPGRYTAGDFGPNELAITLAWTVPVAWYLRRVERGRLATLLLFLHLPLIVVAIVLTASRGGFMTLLVSLLVVVPNLICATWHQRAQWLLTIIVAIAFVGAIAPTTSWERLFTIRAQVESGNLSNRGGIWQAGLRSIDSRNALAGIGTAAYAKKMASVIGVEIGSHNSMISILVDLGIVGASLFALLLLDLVWIILHMEGLTRSTWAVVLAAWFVGVLSMNGEAFKATWVLFSFIASAVAFVTWRVEVCAE